MKRKNISIRFCIQLLVILLFLFAIHIGILNFLHLPLFDNLIVVSYIINFILAAGIFSLLNSLKYKQKNNLGFLFIGGSFLKFIVFFLVFYPIYKQDGEINSLEFSSFFLPYVVCLVLETISLSKILNKSY